MNHQGRKCRLLLVAGHGVGSRDEEAVMESRTFRGWTWMMPVAGDFDMT